MNKIIFLLGFLIFLQSNTGMAGSNRKINYTLQIRNDCKNTIRDLTILYDGEGFFPVERGQNIGYLRGSSYIMLMTIPDEALITWKDFKGIPYEAKVPLRSLIHLSDYFLHDFRIEYQFCDSQLRVVFGKATGQFGYARKEIWNNKKEKAAP